VTARLLTHWAAGGHKALLFCQTRQMLDICEKLVTQLKLTYHRWVC
jgi:DNA excision repair protein ERCC-6